MSHVVIKKSLAKALMDASMQDYGGEEPQKLGLGGLVKGIGGAGSLLSPVTQGPSVITGLFNAVSPSNKFNATDPMIGQQLQTLQGQQADVYGQQQNLAQTLLAQSQGMGPNPALAALNQSTGQNVQQQTAIMAGQRGASANPALLARQAAMQGAGIQQQSVGQAALMQAQQQIQAQQLLQQQQAQMAGQTLQGQSIYTGSQDKSNAINADIASANQNSKNFLLGSLLQTGGMAAGLGGGKKSQGGQIEGQPQVPGDSEANDTQLTLLSPGEIVIPRTIAEHPNAPELARTFVQHLMTQKQGYGGVIQARNKGQGVKKLAEGTKPEDWDPYRGEDPTGNPFNFKGASSRGSDDLGVIDTPSEQVGGGFMGRFKGLFSPEGREELSSAIQQTQAPPLEGTTPMPVDINSSMQATALSSPQMAEAAATNAPLEQVQNQQAAPSQPTAPTTPPVDPFKQSLDQFSSGVNESNKAAGKMYGDIGNATEQSNALEAVRKQKSDESLNMHRAALEKISKDIADNPIKADRFWSNKSTGSKISTILGVLLSGIGAGLQKTTKNMAWEALDKNIENDIQEQKSELGRKQTMYSDNLKLFGNEIDAENATRLQAAAALQGKIAAITAKSQNQILHGEGQQKIAQYAAQMVPHEMALAQSQGEQALKKTLMDKMNSGGLSDMDPASLVPHFVPKEKQEEVFKEVERAKNTSNMAPKILEAFDMSTSRNPVIAARGRKAFEGLINTTVTDLTGTARQAEFDSVHKNYSPSGLTALPGENETMRKSLVNYLNGKSAAPRFKGYVGVDLDKFRSTSNKEPAPSDISVDGARAWLQKNPKGAKADQVRKALGE